MAAKAVAIFGTEKSVWWDRFQNLAESRVQEGNLLAGEQIWQIVKSPELAQVLTIQSTRRPADYVECSMDGQSCVLMCRPGSDIAGEVLSFQLPVANAEQQPRQKSECTIEQALGQILDQLVWDDPE
jgi:hypothetical protein